MNQTVLIKVPGRPSRRPLVVLNGMTVGTQFSTPLRIRIGSVMARIVHALFRPRATVAAGALILALMAARALAAPSAVDAQSRMAGACLLFMPWAIVWTVRYMRTAQSANV